MKKQNYIFSTIIVMLMLSNSAQAWHVNIYGNSSLCAGSDFKEFYTISHNVQYVSSTLITVTGGNIIGINGTPITATTSYSVSRTVPGSMEIQWTQGASIKKVLVEVVSSWFSIKTTKDLYCYEIYNDPIVTVNSSVPSLTCGSTNPITFTAYWSIADSYSWSVSGGSKGSDCNAGSSTCTITPYSSTTVLDVQVTGINNVCGFTRNGNKYLYVAPLSVNAISGPDYVCYGAPSAVSHYVNNIPGVTYEWYATNHSSGQNIVTNSQNSHSIYVNAGGSGPFTLNVKVTGCGTFVIKSKAVNSTNNTPSPPYITSSPGTHCAGSCATYYTQIPTGFAIERQFRYNYGYWDVANSNGSIYICTQSYDAGYRPVELRSKGICGTFSSVYTQSINISYCGYMMATNEADSLALSELEVENEISLYPNPSATTMTISLPKEMKESQVTILSEQGEVITTFDNTKTMFTLNTGKLGRGNYYLSVVGKEKKLTKRFVVE